MSQQTLLATTGSRIGCEAEDGEWYKPGEKIFDNSLPYGLHRLSICQKSGEWLDYDTCRQDMHSNAYRLENARECWSYCYSNWNNNCKRWCSCERDYNNKKLGASGQGGVSPVLVPGITVKPKGDGHGMSQQTLLATTGSRLGCEAQDGEWYNPGDKILDNKGRFALHRLSICQKSGEWLDYDTCPQDMHSNAYRLENARSCWSYCYSNWNNDCARWCSCQRDYNNKKLGASGQGGVSPVIVPGIAVKPKGDGHGMSQQTLLATTGSRLGCEAQDGEWYKPGEKILDNSLPYGLHRLSICQRSGKWLDYDTCPRVMHSNAYRLENAR